MKPKPNMARTSYIAFAFVFVLLLAGCSKNTALSNSKSPASPVSRKVVLSPDFINNLKSGIDAESYSNLAAIYAGSEDYDYGDNFGGYRDLAGNALVERNQDKYIGLFLPRFNANEGGDMRIYGFLMIEKSSDIKTLQYAVDMYLEKISLDKDNESFDNQGFWWCAHCVAALAQRFGYKCNLEPNGNCEKEYFYAAEAQLKQLRKEVSKSIHSDKHQHSNQ